MLVVAECKASDICREDGTDCAYCLSLSEEDWREAVKSILAQGSTKKEK